MDKKGLLIAIEGTDGCGKNTQSVLLTRALVKEGHSLKMLSFPRYESQSSALVKMYLGGDFGADPERVNPFAASSFYAVDRVASYLDSWGEFYESGGLVITDRYTISNAIHQCEKLQREERGKFLEWLYDFEYNKLGIPEPDLVIFLDVPTDITAKLRAAREKETNSKPDIHEKDLQYMARCRASALQIAESSGWVIVNCVKDGELRPLQNIHEEILGLAHDLLKRRDTLEKRPIKGPWLQTARL